jgi:hypothetical protein
MSNDSSYRRLAPTIEDPSLSIDVWLGSPHGAGRFDIDTLNVAERLRHDGLKSDRRRQEFAVSRALRLAALGSTWAEPSIPSSLSHSNGWAAVARAPAGCRVGVDLEFHRERNVLGIARFAFDPEEIALLERLSPQLRDPAFYTLWTMKEAFAKALGIPLLEASRQCVFNMSEPRGEVDSASLPAVTWTGRIPTDRAWLVRVFQPRADMALCVAVIGRGSAEDVAGYEWPDAVASRWPTQVAIGHDAPH